MYKNKKKTLKYIHEHKLFLPEGVGMYTCLSSEKKTYIGMYTKYLETTSRLQSLNYLQWNPSPLQLT